MHYIDPLEQHSSTQLTTNRKFKWLKQLSSNILSLNITSNSIMNVGLYYLHANCENAMKVSTSPD